MNSIEASALAARAADIYADAEDALANAERAYRKLDAAMTAGDITEANRLLQIATNAWRCAQQLGATDGDLTACIERAVPA